VPENFHALAIVLVAIVPGYVATTVWARNRTWGGHPSDLRLIIQSVALSAVLQVVAAPLTIWLLYPHRNELDEYPWRIALWALSAVLILPVVAGWGLARIGEWLGSNSQDTDDDRASGDEGVRGCLGRWWPSAAPPSAWDLVFERIPPNGAFVVVHYEDGSRVAGVFAGRSYALTSPEPHELFLETEWLLDEDGFLEEPVPLSAGVLIRASDTIRSIRIQEA
jgi:hypothetical protein